MIKHIVDVTNTCITPNRCSRLNINHPIIQTFQTILNSGISYIDEQFPPQLSSIIHTLDSNMIPYTIDTTSSIKTITTTIATTTNINTTNATRAIATLTTAGGSGEINNTWRDNITFQRISNHDILSKKIKLFSDEITPHDDAIKLGSFWNHKYFLSGLKILLRVPNLIKRLFITNEINQCGVYCIWVCVNAQWQPVIVDDNLVYFKGNLAGISSINDEYYWAPLLEKAYAKANSSYESIFRYGETEAVLRDFTGAPTISLFHKTDSDMILECIKWSLDNKCLISAQGSFNAQASENNNNTNRTSPFHHDDDNDYLTIAILKHKELKTNKGTTIHLLLLKTLLGDFKWNGSWPKERCLLKKKQDKRIVSRDDNENDEDWYCCCGCSSGSSSCSSSSSSSSSDSSSMSCGCYWMSLEDYVKNFKKTIIVKYREEFYYTSCEVSDVCQFALRFSIESPKEIELNLTLTQPNKRKFSFSSNNSNSNSNSNPNLNPNPESNNPYHFSRLLLGKINEDGGLLFINGIAGSTRDLQLNTLYLDQGSYIILGEIHKRQSNEKEPVVISAYSEEEIQFERLEKVNFEVMMRSLVHNLIISGNENQKIGDYGMLGEPNISKCFGIGPGLIYLYYKNQSKVKILKEIVKFQTTGIELMNNGINIHGLSDGGGGSSGVDGLNYDDDHRLLAINDKEIMIEVACMNRVLVIFKMINHVYSYEFNFESNIEEEVYSKCLERNIGTTYGSIIPYVHDPDDRGFIATNINYNLHIRQFDSDKECLARPYIKTQSSACSRKSDVFAMSRVLEKTLEYSLTNKPSLDESQLSSVESILQSPFMSFEIQNYLKNSMNNMGRGLFIRIDKKQSGMFNFLSSPLKTEADVSTEIGDKCYLFAKRIKLLFKRKVFGYIQSYSLRLSKYRQSIIHASQILQNYSIKRSFSLLKAAYHSKKSQVIKPYNPNITYKKPTPFTKNQLPLLTCPSSPCPTRLRSRLLNLSCLLLKKIHSQQAIFFNMLVIISRKERPIRRRGELVVVGGESGGGRGEIEGFTNQENRVNSANKVKEKFGKLNESKRMLFTPKSKKNKQDQDISLTNRDITMSLEEEYGLLLRRGNSTKDLWRNVGIDDDGIGGGATSGDGLKGYMENKQEMKAASSEKSKLLKLLVTNSVIRKKKVEKYIRYEHSFYQFGRIFNSITKKSLMLGFQTLKGFSFTIRSKDKIQMKKNEPIRKKLSKLLQLTIRMAKSQAFNIWRRRTMSSLRMRLLAMATRAFIKKRLQRAFHKLDEKAKAVQKDDQYALLKRKSSCLKLMDLLWRMKQRDLSLVLSRLRTYSTCKALKARCLYQFLAGYSSKTCEKLLRLGFQAVRNKVVRDKQLGLSIVVMTKALKHVVNKSIMGVFSRLKVKRGYLQGVRCLYRVIRAKQAVIKSNIFWTIKGLKGHHHPTRQPTVFGSTHFPDQRSLGSKLHAFHLNLHKFSIKNRMRLLHFVWQLLLKTQHHHGYHQEGKLSLQQQRQQSLYKTLSIFTKSYFTRVSKAFMTWRNHAYIWKVYQGISKGLASTRANQNKDISTEIALRLSKGNLPQELVLRSKGSSLHINTTSISTASGISSSFMTTPAGSVNNNIGKKLMINGNLSAKSICQTEMCSPMNYLNISPMSICTNGTTATTNTTTSAKDLKSPLSSPTRIDFYVKKSIFPQKELQLKYKQHHDIQDQQPCATMKKRFGFGSRNTSSCSNTQTNINAKDYQGHNHSHALHTSNQDKTCYGLQGDFRKDNPFDFSNFEPLIQDEETSLDHYCSVGCSSTTHKSLEDSLSKYGEKNTKRNKHPVNISPKDMSLEHSSKSLQHQGNEISQKSINDDCEGYMMMMMGSSLTMSNKDDTMLNMQDPSSLSSSSMLSLSSSLSKAKNLKENMVVSKSQALTNKYSIYSRSNSAQKVAPLMEISVKNDLDGLDISKYFGNFSKKSMGLKESIDQNETIKHLVSKPTSNTTTPGIATAGTGAGGRTASAGVGTGTGTGDKTSSSILTPCDKHLNKSHTDHSKKPSSNLGSLFGKAKKPNQSDSRSLTKSELAKGALNQENHVKGDVKKHFEKRNNDENYMETAKTQAGGYATGVYGGSVTSRVISASISGLSPTKGNKNEELRKRLNPELVNTYNNSVNAGTNGDATNNLTITLSERLQLNHSKYLRSFLDKMNTTRNMGNSLMVKSFASTDS